jgi:hypothetical protein
MPSEHLSTIAEVAIALAGFSALVAVLAGQPERGKARLDGLRLQIMLESSLLVVAFALFPIVPAKFGISPEATWRISAIVYLAVDIPLTILSAKRILPVRRLYTAHDRADRATSVAVQALGYGADLAMLTVVLGIVSQLSAAFYFLGLYMVLLLAGILFLRFAASTFVPDS